MPACLLHVGYQVRSELNVLGTQLVGKDEYEQTRQIFFRIDRIIKAAGGTMDNLVKMTIYLVDIRNNTEVWRARREFFTGDFPASTLVEVRSLAKPEVLVEKRPLPI